LVITKLAKWVDCVGSGRREQVMAVRMWRVQRRPEYRDALLVELDETKSRLALRVRDGAHPGMVVALADESDRGWRVRALLAGHEELVRTREGARASLLADYHELFSEGLEPLRNAAGQGPAAHRYGRPGGTSR